ncbi:MAG: hypothetical protein AMDU3_IPLC00001G0258 [Thermoplasmatales archaeon I-plasma]|nr:MAG: hypothetical protein AMDU3_IPLC00001G0258 [Thermoplasmatales archaeon I-plasma]
MIGAIFAGGYGKRMQSVDPELPKVLLPLRDDFVILDKQLYDFESAGLNEVYMLIGYKGDTIVKRYGTQWNGIRIHYLREKEPMGTLWALRNLFSKIESDVLLRNGDTVCDVDLGRFIKYSHYTGKLATIVVVRMRSPFGIVSVEGNTVKKFDEKPLLPYYVNGGTYFLRGEIKSTLRRNFADRGIEGSLFKSLASKGEIAAYKYGGFWKPVDTVKDYEEIKKIFIGRKF